MTVGHPAPVGKSLIFFVGPVRTGFREFLTAKMASGFLGIDGMSMENAMSKKLNGRGGRFVLLAAALLAVLAAVLLVVRHRKKKKTAGKAVK